MREAGNAGAEFHVVRGLCHECVEQRGLSAKTQASRGAKGEARHLIRLLGRNGNTVETLRELIHVAPEEEAILRAFALQHPEMAEHIDRALRYRIRVEEEFERLVSRNTR